MLMFQHQYTPRLITNALLKTWRSGLSILNGNHSQIQKYWKLQKASSYKIMLEGYITPSKETPSRSGLYANLLPGVTLQLLDDLTKDEEEDFEEFWLDIY